MSRKKTDYRYDTVSWDFDLPKINPTFYRQPLPDIDLEAAATAFSCRPGCAVVERLDLPEVWAGGILIAHTYDVENRMGPDVGVVIAAHEDTGLQVGSCVLFNHTHGKWIEDFDYNGYESDREIVVTGRAVCTTGEVLTVPTAFTFLATIDMEATSPNHLQPRENWLLILRDDLTRSVGGIELPLSEQYGRSTGTVISVGPGVLDIEPGDRVLYMASASCRLRQFGFEAGDRHVMLREPAILLVLKSEIDHEKADQADQACSSDGRKPADETEDATKAHASQGVFHASSRPS